MSSYLFLFMIMGVAFAYVSVPNMIEITPSNADIFFGEGSNILVLFYRPHKSNDPIFKEMDKAAEMLENSTPTHNFGYVNIEEYPELGREFRLRILPSIRFIRDGMFCIYKYKNEASEYVKFVTEKSKPIINQISTPKELDKLRSENDLVYTLYLSNEDGMNLDIYKGSAFSYYRIPFVYVIGDKTIKAFDETPNTLVVYKKFDDYRSVLHPPFSLNKMALFVENQSYPVVIDFRSPYHNKAVDVYNNLDTRVLLLADENDQLKPFMDVFTQLARNNLGKAYFVYASPLHKKYYEVFSMHEGDAPTLAILKMNQDGMKKYKYEGDFNLDLLQKYLNQFYANKLPLFYKSEPLPLHQDSTIYELVGKSFNFVVFDEYKNVMVKFYIPDCEFCLNIEEKYKQVAELFSFRDDLIFAEIDMSKNEVEQNRFRIKGYPTILLFPSGDKTPIEFTERVDIEHVGIFLKENTRKVVPPAYHHDEL